MKTVDFESALVRDVVALFHKRFNPNQPRVPAGTPTGGQFASSGGTEASLEDTRAMGHAAGSGTIDPSKQGIGVVGAHRLSAAEAEAKHNSAWRNREHYDPDPTAAATATAYRQSLGLPEPDFGAKKLTDIRAELDRARAVTSLALRHGDTSRGRIDIDTRIAYNDLVRQTGQQLEAMKRAGIHVEYLTKQQIIDRGLDPEGLNPYPTAKAQRDSVSKSSTLMIASIADYPDSWHPLLDSSVGGTYDQFRAVHDYFGHIAVGTGFDRHGEFQAYLHHASMFRGAGRRAAASELHVENSFLAATGMSSPHWAMLLPEELVDPYTSSGAFKGAAWV